LASRTEFRQKRPSSALGGTPITGPPCCRTHREPAPPGLCATAKTSSSATWPERPGPRGGSGAVPCAAPRDGDQLGSVPSPRPRPGAPKRTASPHGACRGAGPIHPATVRGDRRGKPNVPRALTSISCGCAVAADRAPPSLRTTVDVRDAVAVAAAWHEGRLLKALAAIARPDSTSGFMRGGNSQLCAAFVRRSLFSACMGPDAMPFAPSQPAFLSTWLRASAHCRVGRASVNRLRAIWKGQVGGARRGLAEPFIRRSSWTRQRWRRIRSSRAAGCCGTRTWRARCALGRQRSPGS